MKVLTIILAIILCVAVMLKMERIAEEKERDLFDWGCYAGIITAVILNIAFMIIE